MGSKCGGPKKFISFLVFKKGRKTPCIKVVDRVSQDKQQCRVAYRNEVLMCQEMMGFKATNYGLHRQLYLPLHQFFRKCEISLRRIDPRVFILSTKQMVSLSTNSVWVKSVSLELRQRANYFEGSRRTTAQLVSVLCEIFTTIYLPLELLCDSKQEQRKQI